MSLYSEDSVGRSGNACHPTGPWNHMQTKSLMSRQIMYNYIVNLIFLTKLVEDYIQTVSTLIYIHTHN